MSARLWRAPARLLVPFVLAVVATTALVTGSAAPTARPASATTSSASTAINYALAQVGDPYSWGGAGPYSFDCSGLTMASYRAAGIYLPHSSRYQYWYGGWKIPRGYWQPGDLIFWASDTRYSSTIYHVALYLGYGKVVEAPRPGLTVRVAPIWNYSQTMYYAVRPHR